MLKMIFIPRLFFWLHLDFDVLPRNGHKPWWLHLICLASHRHCQYEHMPYIWKIIINTYGRERERDVLCYNLEVCSELPSSFNCQFTCLYALVPLTLLKEHSCIQRDMVTWYYTTNTNLSLLGYSIRWPIGLWPCGQMALAKQAASIYL